MQRGADRAAHLPLMDYLSRAFELLSDKLGLYGAIGLIALAVVALLYRAMGSSRS
jgi:hypothetical protein